jgi:hypothetical protein
MRSIDITRTVSISPGAASAALLDVLKGLRNAADAGTLSLPIRFSETAPEDVPADAFVCLNFSLHRARVYSVHLKARHPGDFYPAFSGTLACEGDGPEGTLHLQGTCSVPLSKLSATCSPPMLRAAAEASLAAFLDELCAKVAESALSLA